jgi:CHAT domain-containing protein
VFAKDLKDTSVAASYICASDLYGMDLNASLAVLGACATGQGRTSKGEGMISLAYAFNYAGCSALVYSLWSVDEKGTSDLMLNFYDGLKKGLPKDDALHEAKLKMLQEGSEMTANPYYWAGFVLSGDVSPIEEMDSTNKFPWYLFVAPFSVLALLPIYLRKRKQTK